METSGSSSTTSEQQLQRREGLNNTKTDVAKQSLISSEEWLQLHGLRSNKLTLKQILSQIGFPHCEDYVASLGRFVASRYAEGLFPRVCRAEDGTAYNLTAKSELIYEFVEHLTQAVKSYKQRMDWLTSRSQQIFGVILEQCITIVLDFGDMREEELNLCQDALKMVLQEQVAHTAKFNIIWASQEPVKWQENAAPVMEQSIAAAISWVEKLTYEQALSPTSRLDALLEAGKDKTTESIYYFVVGDIPEESKQLLLQRALEIPCPVCTVSFNARGEDTIAFLKNLSARTHGRKLAIFALDEVPAGGKHKQIESISFVKGHWTRFHAFAERTECVEFPAFSLKDGDSVVTWNSRKLKGKLPPGAEVREDVFLIWREMEEACSTLAQIQRLMAKPSKSDVATIDCESGATSVGNESNPEDIWDSKKWLQKYGLKAQNLSFYDVLADCSFRHADGVVDIKAKPENEYIQTSAETNKKIVHAKYCSRFVHVPWKNGSLVHVCITKEKCTWYSEKIHAVLAQIQRRIKWLQDGSQILFGKVSNDCNYILIDTSHSMKGKLDLVKDKIIQFIQEQLKFKRKFNFVQFAAQAVAWRDKLVEINEDNLKGAQSWVRNMKTGSSTNTLTALQIAFADKETQAIYLLTDGRPDQPPEMVIDQVKVFQKIPIYTISFNYNDKIANGFLKELASLTGGEFHSYRFGFKDPCPPEAVQNEDLTLLIKEMEQGLSDLEKMQNLYSESLIMDWWYNGEKEGDKHQKEICSLVSTPEKCADPHSDVEATQVSSQKRSKVPEDLSNQKIQKNKVLHAESTKTSLLRSQMSTLKSSACSKKDDFSNSSNWNTPSDREMSIPLTNEYPDDKSLERLTPRGSQVYDQDYSGMSSANWLKTHGLVARKLTIMDALSVTAVPHSPTYIPVLDKHVVSKVFDEVFPLAHVCNDTNRMTLINPQGVKLNIYKQNVEQAIKSYEKRLNKIVWRALSQEEKEKLDANKPMRYLENKAALNEALERLNWPISLKELSLLENEILAGKMYVQQAMELQEAARKENYVSRALAETLAIINPINNSIMDLLENFMWLLPDYRKLVWHLFGVSGQETAIHVHRSGWSPDSFFCSAERPNEASMQTLARSVRIIMDEMRHSHGLPSPVEEKGQHGFSLKGSKSLGPCHDWPLLGFSAHYMMVLIYYAQQQKFQGNSTKKIKSKKLDHLKGQKVIARCDENGFYFPGIVKKCISPTHALVGFRYGDTKVVPISFITPVGGAMPCPLLQVGDYVFAKIVIPNGFDFYVPAIVIAVPNQDVAEDKFYTVLKSNNRREFCPRSALIKISQNKYALSCSHIKSPPVQEDPKVENVDMRNSTFLIRPTKEAGTTDLRELRQENPRRKKKKPAKRLPLLEVVSSDSDDPFHGNRSQESFPKRHTKVGEGRHCLSLEHPETSLD